MNKECNLLKYRCAVVMPVYNEENNILDSLLRLKSQLTADMQLVIVDDGSTDRTSEIIEKFIILEKIYNFSYIKKCNEGAARARLMGINNASSKFIAFIDCDDQIDSSTLTYAIAEFDNNTDIDFVLFDYYSVDSRGKQKRFNYTINDWPTTGSNAFKHTIDSWGIHGFGIYRKNVILDGYKKAFSFIGNENNVNDDELIARCAILESRHVVLSDGRYYYSSNELSTTRRVNNNLYRMLFTGQSLKKIIQNNNNISYLLPAINLYLLRVCTNLAIKQFKWRKLINNNELWSAAIKKTLDDISFISIAKYTSKNYKLFLWSMFKLCALKLRYRFM